MNTIRRLKTENPDNKTARFGNPWKINAAPTQIRGEKKQKTQKENNEITTTHEELMHSETKLEGKNRNQIQKQEVNKKEWEDPLKQQNRGAEKRLTWSQSGEWRPWRRWEIWCWPLEGEKRKGTCGIGRRGDWVGEPFVLETERGLSCWGFWP